MRTKVLLRNRKLRTDSICLPDFSQTSYCDETDCCQGLFEWKMFSTLDIERSCQYPTQRKSADQAANMRCIIDPRL